MNRYPNRHLGRDQTMPQPSFSGTRPMATRRAIFNLAISLCLAGFGTAVAYDQQQIYQLKPNDHILILGDSTTAEGVGVGGYVRLVDQAQHEQIPEKGVVVRAIGGNGMEMQHIVVPQGTIPGAVKSMVGKEHAPTVVVLTFGLNDAKDAVAPGVARYTKSARTAITQLRELKMLVILCTPPLWGGLDATKPYAEAARSVAEEMKVPLIDLYAAHAEQFVKKPSCTRDGVHFSMFGNTFQAGVILQAFGLKPVWKKYQLRLTVCKGSKITQDPELPSNAPTIIPPGNWTENWPLEQAAYAPGTKVTLKVEPEAGYTFLGWRNMTGDATAEKSDIKSSQLTITMDQHKWFMAISQPIEAKKP